MRRSKCRYGARLKWINGMLWFGLYGHLRHCTGSSPSGEVAWLIDPTPAAIAGQGGLPAGLQPPTGGNGRERGRAGEGSRMQR